MKEQMSIECETCGAKSEKMPILTYAGHSKCWNCLAMAGLSGLRNNILRTVSKDEMDRMMEGAHAVNTGAHEGMPGREK